MASSASFHPFLLPYSPHLQPEHLQNLPKPLIVAIHGLLKFMQDALGHEGEGTEAKKIAHLHRSLTHVTQLSATLSSRLNQALDDLALIQSRSSSRIEKLEQERDAVIMVNEMMKRRLAAQTGAAPHVPMKGKGKERVLNEVPAMKIHVHHPLRMRPHSPDTSSISSGSSHSHHADDNYDDSREERSRHLIADLTKALEKERHSRQEERHEHMLKNEALKQQLTVREEELTKFWEELDDFLGLKGFVYSKSMGLIEASETESENNRRKPTKPDDAVKQTSIRQLEREIEELEQELRIVQERRSFSRPVDSSGDESREELLVERSQLKRTLQALNSQITELKVDLKEVERERDQLKEMSKRLGPSPPAASQIDFDAHRMELENENQHLLNLLRNSESHVRALEERLAVQEEEFEAIAQRVKKRLENQASKLEASEADILTIFESLEEAENALDANAELLKKEQERSARLEALIKSWSKDEKDGGRSGSVDITRKKLQKGSDKESLS
ncbi:hypothetical protein BT69DRAFT_1289260 [Atractiella rhizophila]|nr:hypothetical protein BT69DRAFT_1289260 [Atractiella rhizophila]